MICSALTLNSLPEVNLTCSWILFHTLASSICDLFFLPLDKIPQLIYNLLSPQKFGWKNDLLPTLRAAGLDFEHAPFTAWISKLGGTRTMRERGEIRTTSCGQAR
jgi:hypothetical protein